MGSHADLTLRGAEESDIPLLARWRSDPKVLEFYSGRDRPLDEEGVRRHYFARADEPGSPAGVEEYQPCIAELAGRPVAFVQFYLLRRSDALDFGYPSSERSFGIDLFIGAPELWGKGLGTRILVLTRDFLVREKAAKRIVADPRADNFRSIRALERAGFRKVRVLPGHEVFEGVVRDCWLMEYP